MKCCKLLKKSKTLDTLDIFSKNLDNLDIFSKNLDNLDIFSKNLGFLQELARFQWRRSNGLYTGIDCIDAAACRLHLPSYAHA